MGISHYLAMTAAEMAAVETLPRQLAYMACHFSPYGTGLTNFPEYLPKNTMLILNDRIPFQGHAMPHIAEILLECIQNLQCSCLLLDFQRNDTPKELCNILTRALPCPVGIAADFADTTDGPVFLPPPPLDEPLETYLLPWKGRELWLEVEPAALKITVDKDGSRFCCINPDAAGECCFKDARLHCRYRTEVFSDRAEFALQRTEAELAELLAEAEALGITKAISLYQQTKKLPVK